MKKTKNNCLLVMQAMKSDWFQLAKMYEDKGDDTNYHKKMREIMGLDVAMTLLTDKGYFDKMCEAYNFE